MSSESRNSSRGRGRTPGLVWRDVAGLLAISDQPFWTTGEIADYFDVSVPTARKRVKTAIERTPAETKQVGNAKAYYWPADAEEKIYGLDKDLLRESLKESLEGRYLGGKYPLVKDVFPDFDWDFDDRVVLDVYLEDQSYWKIREVRDDVPDSPGWLGHFSEALVSAEIQIETVVPYNQQDHQWGEDVEMLYAESPWLFEPQESAFVETVSIEAISPRGEGEVIGDLDDYGPDCFLGDAPDPPGREVKRLNRTTGDIESLGEYVVDEDLPVIDEDIVERFRSALSQIEEAGFSEESHTRLIIAVKQALGRLNRKGCSKLARTDETVDQLWNQEPEISIQNETIAGLGRIYDGYLNDNSLVEILQDSDTSEPVSVADLAAVFRTAAKLDRYCATNDEIDYTMETTGGA